MSPLGIIFAVILCFTVVYCHPVAEPEADPNLLTEGAKFVGGALAGTVVADAFHAVGGDKAVNAVTNWVGGAVDTAKNWVGGAVDTVKGWLG